MAKIPPLIFEHIQDQSNYLFLTLIEHKKVKYLTIIENVVNDEIQAYVLDKLAAYDIDQEMFMTIATKWFYSASERYPLSFEFAKLGLSNEVSKVIKTFNMNSTSRIIGNLFSYKINTKPKIKRRKVTSIDEIAEIKFKT